MIHGLWGLTGGSDAGRCPVCVGCRLVHFLRPSRHVTGGDDRDVDVVGGQWEMAVWALANFCVRAKGAFTLSDGDIFTPCPTCKRLIPLSSEAVEGTGILYCHTAGCRTANTPVQAIYPIAASTLTEALNGCRRLAGGVRGYSPLRGVPVALQLPVLHCTGNIAKRVVLFILACQPEGLQDKARRVLLAIAGKGCLGSLYLREFRELVAAAVVHPDIYSNHLDPAFFIMLQLTQLMNASWREALTGPDAVARAGGAAAAQLAASLLGPLWEDVKPLDPVTKDTKVATLYLHAPIAHMQIQLGVARSGVALVSDDNMEGHLRGVGRFLHNHGNSASPAELLSNMAAVQQATIHFSTPRSHPSALVFTEVIRVCKCCKAFGRDGTADFEAIRSLGHNDAELELEVVDGGDELKISLHSLKPVVAVSGTARQRADGTKVRGKKEALRRGLRRRQRVIVACVCGRLNGGEKSAVVEHAAARRAAAMRAAVAAGVVASAGGESPADADGDLRGAASATTPLSSASSDDDSALGMFGADRHGSRPASLGLGLASASSAESERPASTAQLQRRARLAALPSFFPPPELLPLVFSRPAVYSSCEAVAALPGEGPKSAAEVNALLLEQAAVLRLFVQRTKSYPFAKWATGGSVNGEDVCTAAAALLQRLRRAYSERIEWDIDGGRPVDA
ncbi:hypothetical protein BU14_0072s0018 [Porphyra umbilicalis]|uniref:Uncharacterized protein n=1 Tax=Porphyra umbilicalis TaxID=2786 RepID=A0A1X6PFP9_PORUM|nr:hypothetical protein BU14_0072s0018 [Porphyra umbilicalis]|eukprot:OSX79660.1 hypothetical protein BU14_0072s0018 [Porphyra umbilicalis]